MHWQQLADLNGRLLLDVRNVDEYEAGHVEGAVNIPLAQLRDRLPELNPEQNIWVYCQVGQRAYYATRVLRLKGKPLHIIVAQQMQRHHSHGRAIAR